MRFIPRTLFSLALLVAATAAWAQETGSISGHVTDATGLAVPGATVKVSGPQLPAGRTSVTTASGGYNFQRLLPGSYKVEAALQGLGNAASTATVSVDKDTQVGLKLISRTATEVVVTAEAIQVDKKSAEVGTSYSSSEIKELPLARTYSGLLQLVAGAPDPTVVGTIVGVSIAGGTRQDSKYQVDGVDITNPGYGTLNIQTNDIDIVDFDVKRGGISAEFGRTSGAIVNAVTKSGTNDFHGVARLEALPANFIAKPTGTTTAQKIDSYTGAAGLGFPIVKDTLFGYVSGRYYSTTSSGQSSIYGAQPDSTTKNQDYFGKLTGNFGSSFLLNASFRALPIKQTNYFDSLLDAPTAAYGADTTNYVGNATASFFLSNNSFLEAKYIHLTENDTSQAQVVIAAQPGTIDPAHLGNFGKYADPARGGGNSGIPEYAASGDSYKRDEIRLSASQFLDLGPTQHQIKVGGGYENDDYTLVRQTNGWGSFIFATCPAGVCGPSAVTGTIRGRYYTLQPTQTGKARTYSAFLQDHVTWNRLSVNLGVLVNKDDFAQIALNGTRYNFMTFNWDQEIQPRLGIAYNSDLMKGDKFYGSYGRYSNLDQKTTSRSFAPFRIRQDYAYFSGTTGNFLGNQVRGSSAGKVIPPDLKPPYYDEIMAGYEAPIANILSANVYYQYRSLHQAFEDNPIDPNNYNGSFQAANIPGASKIYRGYTLELNKRLADHWAASLSYTYSQLTGNFDEDYDIEIFNTSSILEDGPGVNSAEPNRYGNLANDRPHIFKAFASYDTPFGVTLGGYYRYQSGRPWEAHGHDPVSSCGCLRYLEPAGSRRLPGWSNFDLLAAYNFRFGGSYNVRLEGRVLNVFNSQPGLSVNNLQYLDPYVDGVPAATLGPQGTKQPNPTFGQYTTYAQPRRFVATLIFEF
jgi:Carboxypeptidase regulatory-like domain